jgi:hypothetical protein
MRTLIQKTFTYLGLVSWGDIAELTIYRSHRGQLVIFKKTYPDKPLSEDCQRIKRRWKQTSDLWQSIGPTHRATWSTAAHRASLAMSGYNLFVAADLSTDRTWIRTIERQTNTTLQGDLS